jgi:hypothetical protein
MGLSELAETAIVVGGTMYVVDKLTGRRKLVKRKRIRSPKVVKHSQKKRKKTK